jgi:uncharacterized protein (TIGR02246 family)
MMNRRLSSPSSRRFVSGLLLLALAGLAPGVQAADKPDNKRIEIDRCITGKCKYGRWDSITVTPELFMIRIQPNWCVNSGYLCSVSYAGFTANDASGPDLRVTGYELGTKSSTMFVVYVPRHFNAVYIHNVNGTHRDAVLDLRPYQKYVDAIDPYGGLSTGTGMTAPEPPKPEPPKPEPRATASPTTPAVAAVPTVSTSGGRAGDTLRIDELFLQFAEGYRTLNAEAVAALYTDDAIYLAPEGDPVRGREAIADRFREIFARASGSGQSLEIEFTTVERAIDGSTAYEVGTYRLERSGGEPSRGKFSLVLRRDGKDWLIHVDSHSPAPLQ